MFDALQEEIIGTTKQSNVIFPRFSFNCESYDNISLYRDDNLKIFLYFGESQDKTIINNMLDNIKNNTKDIALISYKEFIDNKLEDYVITFVNRLSKILGPKIKIQNSIFTI